MASTDHGKETGEASGPAVIDFHAHVVIPELYANTRSHSLFARTLETPGAPPDVARRAAERGEAVIRRMSDVDDRLRTMDETGVAMQVLTCSIVHHYSYWAEPAESLALERRCNDRVAEIVAAHPTRFAGLGGVPLHAPDLAADELERCVSELGLKGVQISTQARELEIGDPSLRPFWARAEALGAVVYVHPAGNSGERLRKFQLWNSLGQSMEEAFAIASLFYEGILDAYPALKVCISHGGGYMPYNTGRVDRNYVEKPATRVNMSKAPADYLRMLYYDSCVYDDTVLRHLVDKVGADRVVLGSDYPVGDPNPVDAICNSGILSSAERTRILHDNAASLLGLNHPAGRTS